MRETLGAAALGVTNITGGFGTVRRPVRSFPLPLFAVVQSRHTDWPEAAMQASERSRAPGLSQIFENAEVYL